MEPLNLNILFIPLLMFMIVYFFMLAYSHVYDSFSAKKAIFYLVMLFACLFLQYAYLVWVVHLMFLFPPILILSAIIIRWMGYEGGIVSLTTFATFFLAIFPAFCIYLYAIGKWHDSINENSGRRARYRYRTDSCGQTDYNTRRALEMQAAIDANLKKEEIAKKRREASIIKDLKKDTCTYDHQQVKTILTGAKSSDEFAKKLYRQLSLRFFPKENNDPLYKIKEELMTEINSCKKEDYYDLRELKTIVSKYIPEWNIYMKF